MLKIIGSLLKGAGLNTIVLVILAGACLYFGWSYHNRGQKVKDLTAEVERSGALLKLEKKTSDSLLRQSKSLVYRIGEDSVYNAKMVGEFQTLIKQVRDAKLRADIERDLALTGVLCYKVNIFGRKKLVNCDEL